MGRMGGPGPGFGPALASCNIGGPALDEATRKAVETALEDERKAEATYSAMVEQLGSVPPFSRLVLAEKRHAAALERVLATHGHAIPAARVQQAPSVPTRGEACKMGVDAEKRNVALYDELSKVTLPRDVQCVFEHLRTASETRHLQALGRCSG